LIAEIRINKEKPEYAWFTVFRKTGG